MWLILCLSKIKPKTIGVTQRGSRPTFLAMIDAENILELK